MTGPPIRVLYVLHTSATSGAGLSLQYLIESLPAGAVQAAALCPPGPLADRLRSIGVDVRSIPGISMLVSAEGIPLRGLRLLDLLRTAWHTRHAPTIRRAIQELRPDVVHLNDRGMLHAAVVAKRAGVPVVMHARSVAHPAPRWVARLSSKVIRQVVDRVVAIDESVRRSLGDLPRVEVIYNPYGGSSGELKPAGGSILASRPDGTVRVTYLTGLLTFKGIWDLLEAARLLRGRRDILFLIAGGNSRPAAFHGSLRGWLAHLFGFAPDVGAAVRAWVERQELGATVRLLGPVDRVQDVLRESDILAFPSHLNGPGRAVFEAGMYGIPAVVALRDRVEDVVQDGVTGLVVPPMAPRRLAEAIVRLADDPGLRERLGTAARTRYAAQFDPRAAGRRILEIYWELVGSARLPGAPSPAA